MQFYAPVFCQQNVAKTVPISTLSISYNVYIHFLGIFDREFYSKGPNKSAVGTVRRFMKCFIQVLLTYYLVALNVLVLFRLFTKNWGRKLHLFDAFDFLMFFLKRNGL